MSIPVDTTLYVTPNTISDLTLWKDGEDYGATFVVSGDYLVGSYSGPIATGILKATGYEDEEVSLLDGPVYVTMTPVIPKPEYLYGYTDPNAGTPLYGWSQPGETLYAWYNTPNDLTVYTKTSTPNVGTALYDANGDEIIAYTINEILTASSFSLKQVNLTNRAKLLLQNGDDADDFSVADSTEIIEYVDDILADQPDISLSSPWKESLDTYYGEDAWYLVISAVSFSSFSSDDVQAGDDISVIDHVNLIFATDGDTSHAITPIAFIVNNSNYIDTNNFANISNKEAYDTLFTESDPDLTNEQIAWLLVDSTVGINSFDLSNIETSAFDNSGNVDSSDLTTPADGFVYTMTILRTDVSCSYITSLNDFVINIPCMAGINS